VRDLLRVLPSAVRGHGRLTRLRAVPHGCRGARSARTTRGATHDHGGPRRRRDPMRTVMTSEATIELWNRLERPFDPTEAVEAFTGLRRTAARQFVGASLATSREADHLLDHMHEIVRSLAVATSSSPTRSEGDVRGPVLW